VTIGEDPKERAKNNFPQTL